MEKATGKRPPYKQIYNRYVLIRLPTVPCGPVS